MIYKFNYSDAILEFIENRGRAFLAAPDPAEALNKTRELFAHSRDEQVQTVSENQYLVHFKVVYNYRRGLFKDIERAIKSISTVDLYKNARYIDRYILAHLKRNLGLPEWLNFENFKEEIRALRRAAVVAREVNNITDFIDWDICIYNYIELNSKEGHKSRVVREVK